MYRMRRQVVAGVMAVTLVALGAGSARAQPAPVGSSSPGGAPPPQPQRVAFTRDSLPEMLKQLGYTVTAQSLANGKLYWQIVAQSGDWRFTVRVLPIVHEEKIVSLLLSSDLGRKISPQAGAQDLLKLLAWNREHAYLAYFAYNAQSGCITAQRPYQFPDATLDELRWVFDDFFKGIRETYPLWNPLSGPTPSAGNGGPAPAGTPAQAPPQPAANDITGSTWTGTENLPGYGKLTFEFGANGAATMIDTKGETPGTWTQSGSEVTIRFDGCVYQGRNNGQTLSGSGRLTGGPHQGQTWSFQVSLQKS
jgi:hypothetical protein